MDRNNSEVKIGPGKIAYSINEIANLLGLSVGHLRNENSRGRLRFVRSGRRILILDDDLRRYLEASDKADGEKQFARSGDSEVEE